MLLETDEKQITWDDMDVAEDFGPSPVEVVSPLLELLRQHPHHFRRECECEWPDDVECGVDLAIEGSDETVLMEYYRGQITRVFGVPAEDLHVTSRCPVNAFKESIERGDFKHIRLYHMYGGLCTPHRNVLTQSGLG